MLLSEEQEDALTQEALAQAKAGGPFIPHEDMVKWMNSLGTDNELPPPHPTVKL
jgi:predicted transcriptional regulator